MELTDKERIAYLANIIAVARADGRISPMEKSVITRIQKRIKAKKSELNKAESRAESSEFEITPVGRFSVKIQNLEDMIHISVVDGSLDTSEKSVVIEFAKAVGVTQEQFKTIVAEVKNYLASETNTVPCPKCETPIPRSAKFCPNCGSSILEADKEAAIAVSYEIPKSGLALEFAESTASSFPEAVRIAKAAPICTTAVKGKKTWYLAAWPTIEILEAMKLANNLKGLRNRCVFRRIPSTHSDLNRPLIPI
ncbi:MAG TPA: zinc-ribbon domain-containing protein [Desulfobacteraceae bacterium]|nr:zinc-ribbon domain-containing protein [Desulfobacteraceae bacterium]